MCCPKWKQRSRRLGAWWAERESSARGREETGELYLKARRCNQAIMHNFCASAGCAEWKTRSFNPRKAFAELENRDQDSSVGS